MKRKEGERIYILYIYKIYFPGFHSLQHFDTSLSVMWRELASRTSLLATALAKFILTPRPAPQRRKHCQRTPSPKKHPIVGRATAAIAEISKVRPSKGKESPPQCQTLDEEITKIEIQVARNPFPRRLDHVGGPMSGIFPNTSNLHLRDPRLKGCKHPFVIVFRLPM